MFNVKLVKSGKIKVVSVMLSLALIFLSIPAVSTKATSYDSSSEVSITASSCAHTYVVIRGYQAPRKTYTHQHNYKTCYITEVYNVYELVCNKCWNAWLTLDEFSHYSHTVSD